MREVKFQHVIITIILSSLVYLVWKKSSGEGPNSPLDLVKTIFPQSNVTKDIVATSATPNATTDVIKPQPKFEIAAPPMGIGPKKLGKAWTEGKFVVAHDVDEILTLTSVDKESIYVRKNGVRVEPCSFEKIKTCASFDVYEVLLTEELKSKLKSPFARREMPDDARVIVDRQRAPPPTPAPMPTPLPPPGPVRKGTPPVGALPVGAPVSTLPTASQPPSPAK